MYIIAGLGNPGGKYEKTKHNMGFQVIDLLADKYHIEMNQKKHKAICGTGVIEGVKVLLLKPQTFMKLSGDAVGPRAKFYKIPPENVIIIYDDVSLPVGKMRIRRKGSRGGHNGIKSIIARLGSQDFPRVKIGVGQKPTPAYDLADWVLGRFPKEQEPALKTALEHATAAVRLLVEGKTDEAMNLYNR